MKKLALQHLFRQLDRFGTANGSSISQSLQLAARKQGQKQHLDRFPFSDKALHTSPIKTATPSGSAFLPTVRKRLVSQCTPKEPFGSLSPTPPWFRWTPLTAAARAGASDCAGFAPNKTQTRLSLTALSLAPCHLHKPPFSFFHRAVCFCPLALK